MATALQIVMDDRKKLVEEMIVRINNGATLSQIWNPSGLIPMNPISNVIYKGGNRLRLSNAVMKNDYKDPRWMTLKQLSSHGYHKNPSEPGVLCEKWIFHKKERKKDEHGKMVEIVTPLERPIVSYFIVYNAEQILDFPPLIKETKKVDPSFDFIDKFMASSECPINESSQPQACYIPSLDKICLPPRDAFRDSISFINTVIHEMGHSTGHSSRLNRNLSGHFGSPEYAKEELRAELSSLFIGSDFRLPVDESHLDDHSAYLASWVHVLQDDPNELFRAAADAEKISERLLSNYCKKYDLSTPAEDLLEINKVKDISETIRKDKPKKMSR